MSNDPNRSPSTVTRRTALAGVGMVGLLVGSVSSAAAQTPEADVASAEAVREAERARVGALVDADVAVTGPLHTDDFQHISPVGAVLPKEDLLGAVGAGILDFVAWEIDEIEVRLYGDVAAIRYQAELDVTFQGQGEGPLDHWFSVLYERHDGNWQAVWSQTTFIVAEAPGGMPGTPAAGTPSA